MCGGLLVEESCHARRAASTPWEESIFTWQSVGRFFQVGPCFSCLASMSICLATQIVVSLLRRLISHRIYPANAVYPGVIISDGRIKGIWRSDARRTGKVDALSPFTTLAIGQERRCEWRTRRIINSGRATERRSNQLSRCGYHRLDARSIEGCPAVRNRIRTHNKNPTPFGLAQNRQPDSRFRRSPLRKEL